MREIRCGQCSRLLAKGEALDLSIKCPRCGAINHVMRAESPSPESQGAPTMEPSRGQAQDDL
ncbi:Com family DNA-binding transcriptional regulator [Solidesulfovibrio sp.]|uniref:Com family DNA-binding transcriptional regulator n=1 Tax=Solidesulfovibrio sp. TaxID=2910990 RepID=UPI002B20EB17|nr:Com family DNA-binding transcriptional regulator [Solidesulfovibrio sp.]MEA5089509.1 Com family DNA-binding transcriptional regulator [Solidesulfovibrio sp.]